MKVDKPMFKVGEYAHKFINHQFNFPGRVVWDPITITYVDTPGSNGPQSKITKLLGAMGYAAPTTNNAQAGLDGVSKASATTALGTVTITQLKASAPADNNAPADGGAGGADAATGTHAQGAAWTLSNAFITDVKFGSLDYSSEDAVQITITVRYDWATAGAAASDQADAGAGEAAD